MTKKEEQLKKKDDDLRELERIFHVFTEKSKEAVFLIYKDKIEYVNPALLKMSGYKEGELKSKSFLFLIVGPEKKKFKEQQKAHMLGKSFSHIGETKMLCRNNKEIDVEYAATLMKHKKGKAVLVAFRDISERKKAEYFLSLSEKKYRRLFEAAKDAILIVDYKTGKIIDANPFVQKLLDRPLEDVTGKEIWEISPFRNVVANRKQFRKLQKEKYIRYENLPLETSQGKFVPVEFISNVYKINNKPVIQCNIRDVAERKKAEERMRKSEEKLKIVTENIKDAVFAKDIDRRYTFVNSAAAEIIGLPIDKIIGKKAEEIFSKKNAQTIKKVDDINFKGQKVDQTEKMTIGKQERFLYTSQNPTRDKEGSIVGIVGIVRDITEENKTKEALKKSEERFRLVAETTNDLIYEWDIITDRLDWFGDIDSVLGYKKGGFPRTLKAWVGAIHPEDFKAVKEVIAQQRNVGGLTDIEYRIKKKDGSWRYWTDKGLIIADESGKPSKQVGACTDITESREVEEKLKRSEKKYRHLINTIDVGVYINTGGAHGQFLDINNAMINMFGYNREEFDKIRVSDLYQNPNDRKLYIDEVVKNGEARNRELFLKKKDGTRLTALVTAKAVFDERGRLKWTEGVIKDITEIKKAQEALKKTKEILEIEVQKRTKELADANEHLKELDRLKNMFMTSMSHELRTPLNSIIGFTDIMLDGFVGDVNPEQRKQLGIIKNSADYLLSLVNDIIDIGKIEAGKMDFDIKRFDAREMFEKIRNHFKLLAREKNVELLFNVPENLIIENDEKKIEQIIMNLVGNAIKFTDRGVVRVKVEQKDNKLKVSVQDTGIGIKKEDIDLLFQAFSRVETKNLPKREGTGIGLYLSQRIAKALGGEIRIKSEIGKGSEFTLFAPLKYDNF